MSPRSLAAVTGPNKLKDRRCKWYNDFGYPRINPAKLERGYPDPTGCTRTAAKCFYAHPDHPDWETAELANPPKYFEYPDKRVPRTPDPPWTRRDTRTPELHVKAEPVSPRLSLAGLSSKRDRSMSEDRGSSRAKSMSSRGPLSPSYILDQDRNRDRDREDYRSGDKGRGYSDRGERERAYGHERERDKSIRDYGRDREYSRGERDRRDSSSSRYGSGFKNISTGDRERTRTTSGGSARTPPRPGASLLDRMFDREPASPPGAAPRWPAVFRDHAQHAFDPSPLPPSHPPPSLPPPPPIRPPSRSSVACDAGPSSSAVPETAMPTGSFSMPPPPTPMSTTSSTTTFLYSLPPKPELFDAPQTQDSVVQKEPLTPEERAELWDKRIELLSEAILAKRAYGERIADIKQLRALAAPERTALLPPAVREQIAASVQTVQAQVDSARARTKAAHQKVLELDFWPVRRRPEPYDIAKKEEDDDKALIEDEHSEIKERVSELGDAISRIDRQMKEVTQFVSSRSRSGAAPTPSTSAPMDWEASDAARGTKRRKTGDDGAYASDSGSATLGRFSPAPSASTPTDTTLDSRRIAHRIAKLESSFHELENLYTQAESHAQEELSAVVDMHVDRVREELVRGVKVRHSERVDKLEEDMAQIDKEVQELVGEVTTLVGVEARVQEVERFMAEERQQIERERAELRAAMDENANRTSAMEAQIAANIEETHALRRALTLITQKPSTPVPHVPTVDDLAAALLPRMLDAVRADLEPRLVDQKTDVVKLMQESAPQVDALRERVERVVQLPEVLAAMQSAGVLNVNGSGAESSTKKNGKMNAVQVNGNGLPPKPPPPL